MHDSKIYNELIYQFSTNLVLLKDKPEETPESTLDALWLLAAGDHKPIQQAKSEKLKELSDSEIDTLKKLVQKRLSGIPLAHIIGRQLFMDIEFITTKDALIPRRETELLGYNSLKYIQEIAKNQNEVNVIDVCTGSGNLALAFSFYEPKVKVGGSDISEKAITLAIKNAEKMQLSDRAKFYVGDFLEPFKINKCFNKIDVLTCNPPYISNGKLETMPKEIIDYEPDIAFNGGPFGLSILSRLIKEAPLFLRTGGWLAFEIGLGQGPGIIRMLNKNDTYKEINEIMDDDGNIRAIITQV